MSTSERESTSPDTRWPAFFEHFGRFDQRRKEEKQSGLNDYSLLAAVLNISDEVHLHSKFLFSTLNPNGAHYQDSAFCREFVTALGYPDFLDWSKLRVFREHSNIDLYLTDGERHVLIENKLNAIDQREQVSRYIDQVKAECNAREMPASPDSILFVYLSNGRQAPSPGSLRPYQLDTSIDGLFVVDGDRRKVARYANAHYGTHILSWISSCLELVGGVDNLENIRNSFVDYRSVVERVTKTYKSRVMNLEDFLLQSSPELGSRARIGHAFTIARQVSFLKAKWLASMFEPGLRELLQEHVARGSLTPIDATDSKDLESMQFASEHARRFFAGKGARNRGKFWRVSRGSASGSAALAVLFGARNLHIGVLPIRVSVAGHVEFDDKPIDEFMLLVAMQRFEFRRHTGINSVFRNLVSWTAPLDAEIEDLANFEGSRSKLIINALVEHLLQSANTQE
jgi:hypothetical protein